MAVIKQSTNEGTNYYQDLFKANTLIGVTPKGGTTTVIRPYPQLAEDGSAVPMVIGMTEDGPDFSGICIENVVIGSGTTSSKFTGLCKCIDRPELKAFDQPAAGAYIRLKSSLDKNKLQPGDHAVVEPAFRETPSPTNPKMKNKAISNGRDALFIQGAILVHRNQDLGEKYIPNGALICTGSLFNAIGTALSEAHAQGIDVFAPTGGYTLIVESLPADPKVGRQTSIFTVRLGDQMDLADDHLAKYVKPWEDALNYMTYDDQLKKMVAAFGRQFMTVAFPSEMAIAFGDEPAHHAAAAPQQPLGKVGAMRQPGAVLGGSTPPTGPGRPSLPGLKPATAAKPAAAALPRTLGAAKPAAAPAAIAAAAASDLEAEYNKILEEQQKQSAPE
jgi:hypothetical protein